MALFSRTVRAALTLALLLAMCSVVSPRRASAAAYPVFSDGFESGDLSAWTQVQTGADGSVAAQRDVVRDGIFTARLSASDTAGSYAFARAAVPVAQSDVTASGDFLIASAGDRDGYVPLLTVLDATGGRIAQVYRHNQDRGQVWLQYGDGLHYYRTDARLPVGRWAHVAMHVVIGPNGSDAVELRVNGTAVYADDAAGLGTSGVSSIQIGNDEPGQPFTLFADNISLSTPATATGRVASITCVPNQRAGSVAPGATVPLTAAISSTSDITGAIASFEVYDSSGTKVYQTYTNPQNILAGSPAVAAGAWTTASDLHPGAYSVKVLVFGFNWSYLSNWSDGCISLTVNGASQPRPAPSATDSAPTATTAPATATQPPPAATPAPSDTPTSEPPTPTSASAPSATPATPASGGHAIKTAFVIVLENHDWSAFKGNPSAPYLNGTLLPQAAHAEDYNNPPGFHPSEPNYLALEAGTNFGIYNDNAPASNHQATTAHLTTLLAHAGVSWKAYEENIAGTSCPLSDSYPYAARHDPFVYFDDVTGGLNTGASTCIAHIRPYGELATDLANDTVARYNFITPNVCDDGHDSCAPYYDEVKQTDTWLAQHIPAIMASAAYKDGGAIFITWDEGEGNDGPIGLLVLSPDAKHGYSNSTYYTHYSTLRTLEEIYGVTPLLGGAAGATDLHDLFTQFP